MRRIGLVLGLVAIFLCITNAAPAQSSKVQRIGVLVVAHGGDSTWKALVRETVSKIETGGPVGLSLLMGPEASTHRFQDVARRLEAEGATEIVVVPLLVSSHSGHFEQIRFLAGLTDTLDAVMRTHLHHAGIEPAQVGVPVRVARALDDDIALARVLAER